MMTQTITLKEFFGLLPGQTTTQFVGELKKLSHAEKTELATLAKAELIKAGRPATEFDF